MSLQFQPPRVGPIMDIQPAHGLRLALAMLMNEALEHGYYFCALHLKVAMSELSEIIGDNVVE